MTTARLRYSRDEILTDPDYATRIERNGVLLHGGYAADGTYLPPRSVHRVPAIAAWAAQLEAGGLPAAAVFKDDAHACTQTRTLTHTHTGTYIY